MKTVRRFAYAAFVVACLHLVFGAIVRISGSGMGCGPHWPKCYGHWFPPMSRPDLVIEVMHRYLASVLLLSLVALVAAALRHRDEPGVGGPGGVLRPAVAALSLGVGAALLGAVTVKFGNAPLATLAHWTVAMSLVAAVTATVIRAGGLGGARARAGGASARARRSTFAAAALALTAVVMGGLTAKYPGAPVACQTFLPFCTPNPDVVPAAVHVQVTHRWIAVLLVLHLAGLFFAFRKRGEPPIIRRAATIALSLGVLQLLVAGAMIGMHLPPVLRSLHEATGVSIWIATFALAYLTRIASEGAPARVARDLPRSPVVSDVPEAGIVRAITGRDTAVTAAEAGIAKAPVAVLEPAAVAETVAVLAAAADAEPIAFPNEPATSEPAVELHPFAPAASLEAVTTADSVEEPDPVVARRTIFDEADDLAAEDVSPDSFGPDPFEEAEDLDAEPAEPILSLDEEFSRLAVEAEETTEPELVAVAETAPSPRAATAVRASTMGHSVAVIVSRGADF